MRLEMPYHSDTINAEVRALKILYPDKKSHEARNEREMILNQSVTPDVAANIAFVERLIEEIATKDFRDTREKLRDAIRGALKNNVSAKNAFTEAEQLAERATTDELRKSRAEVSRLIAEAKQKIGDCKVRLPSKPVQRMSASGVGSNRRCCCGAHR